MTKKLLAASLALSLALAAEGFKSSLLSRLAVQAVGIMWLSIPMPTESTPPTARR
jgi:hypothetical protein